MTTPSGGAPGAPTDADLIRAQLAALGLSQREAARKLEVDERTMRYYCAGREPVPATVFLALRQLEQIRRNDQCLALLADGTMSTSDGELTAERLREANETFRSAIELLLRPLRAPPPHAPGAAPELAPAPPVAHRGADSHNLLKPEWSALESDDLRVLIENRIGGPGQSSGEPGDHRFYLPLAGAACRVAVRFAGTNISAVEPGPAFDALQWSQITDAVDALVHTEPTKIGRNVAFSAIRVTGCWRGERSGVQILPAPADAPAVPTEMGEHPFVLEFPMHADAAWPVMNMRRLREHRRLALLLNVLLVGGTRVETRQTEHVWAYVDPTGPNAHSQWLQRSYFTNIGEVVVDAHSSPGCEPMEVRPPEEYYAQIGLDGSALRVPSDLDESICRYRDLAPEFRERFDRALIWLDNASRAWTSSMSSSFASLVSAIEALTVRGAVHRVYCAECNAERDHDVPGPTALFKNFFETYAPGLSQRKQRDQMYRLRSRILHGDELIAFDEGRAIGWDPPWSNQNDLHRELWTITRIAMRNYLRNPGGATSAAAK
jgi:hypothetical protein